MKYILLFLASLLLCFCPEELSAIGLKPQVVVDGDSIKLGDVFVDVDKDKVDQFIMPAPALGQKTFLDANQLEAIARNHNFLWAAPDKNMVVAVERQGKTLSDQEILDVISDSISSQLGQSNEYEIRMDRTHPEFIVGVNETDSVAKVDTEIKGKRFKSIISLKDGRVVQIGGQVEALISIPVLARAILPGGVIEEKDLEEQQVLASRVNARIVTDRDALIGAEPKNRALHPGKPIMTAEIQKPVLVKRNQIVEMRYKTPNMLLTGKGQALQNGGGGDIVRVMNPTSKKVVNGLVVGQNQVDVSLGG